MEPSVQVEGSERSSFKNDQQHKKCNKIRGTDEVSHEHSLKPALDKKERNKASAKQCRDRKKLYIQILEEKQRTLRKQL